MLARQVVLLTPSESIRPPQLPFYKLLVQSTSLCFHAFTHSFSSEKKLSHFPSTVCALLCNYGGVGVSPFSNLLFSERALFLAQSAFREGCNCGGWGMGSRVRERLTPRSGARGRRGKPLPYRRERKKNGKRGRLVTAVASATTVTASAAVAASTAVAASA